MDLMKFRTVKCIIYTGCFTTCRH